MLSPFSYPSLSPILSQCGPNNSLTNSGNSDIDNAILRADGGATPGVTVPPSGTDSSCVAQIASNLSTLWIPGRRTGWYVLQGASGKGDFGLQQSWDPNPRRGSQTLYTDWTIMKNRDRGLLLRYSDPLSQSHWIATRTVTDDRKVKWVPRWISPNSANMGDNEPYVLIDIELVELPANAQAGDEDVDVDGQALEIEL
jgi:hypothetical protein